MIWGIDLSKQREGTAQENESFKSLSTKSREQGHEQGEAAHVSAHASYEQAMQRTNDRKH